MGGAVPSNSTEQCCAECLATQGCKFGVWMNNGGLLQCYLKDASAVGSGYTHAGRYSCAPKAAAAPNVALEVAESTVTAKDATEASQKWEYVKNPDGSLTIRQGGLCITNNLAF